MGRYIGREGGAFDLAFDVYTSFESRKGYIGLKCIVFSRGEVSTF